MVNEKALKRPTKRVGLHVVGEVEHFFSPETGKLSWKKFPGGGGTQYFDENEKLAYVEFSDGGRKFYDTKGVLIQHLDPDGKEIPVAQDKTEFITPEGKKLEATLPPQGPTPEKKLLLASEEVKPAPDLESDTTRESTRQSQEEIKQAQEEIRQAREALNTLSETTEEEEVKNLPEKKPNWLKKNWLKIGLATGIVAGGAISAKMAGEYLGELGYKDPDKKATRNMTEQEKRAFYMSKAENISEKRRKLKEEELAKKQAEVDKIEAKKSKQKKTETETVLPSVPKITPIMEQKPPVVTDEARIKELEEKLRAEFNQKQQNLKTEFAKREKNLSNNLVAKFKAEKSMPVAQPKPAPRTHAEKIADIHARLERGERITADEALMYNTESMREPMTIKTGRTIQIGGK